MNRPDAVGPLRHSPPGRAGDVGRWSGQTCPSKTPAGKRARAAVGGRGHDPAQRRGPASGASSSFRKQWEDVKRPKGPESYFESACSVGTLDLNERACGKMGGTLKASDEETMGGGGGGGARGGASQRLLEGKWAKPDEPLGGCLGGDASGAPGLRLTPVQAVGPPLTNREKRSDFCTRTFRVCKTVPINYQPEPPCAKSEVCGGHS